MAKITRISEQRGAPQPTGKQPVLPTGLQTSMPRQASTGQAFVAGMEALRRSVKAAVHVRNQRKVDSAETEIIAAVGAAKIEALGMPADQRQEAFDAHMAAAYGNITDGVENRNVIEGIQAVYDRRLAVAGMEVSANVLRAEQRATLDGYDLFMALAEGQIGSPELASIDQVQSRLEDFGRQLTTGVDNGVISQKNADLRLANARTTLYSGYIDNLLSTPDPAKPDQVHPDSIDEALEHLGDKNYNKYISASDQSSLKRRAINARASADSQLSVDAANSMRLLELESGKQTTDMNGIQAAYEGLITKYTNLVTPQDLGARGVAFIEAFKLAAAENIAISWVEAGHSVEGLLKKNGPLGIHLTAAERTSISTRAESHRIGLANADLAQTIGDLVDDVVEKGVGNITASLLGTWADKAMIHGSPVDRDGRVLDKADVREELGLAILEMAAENLADPQNRTRLSTLLEVAKIEGWGSERLERIEGALETANQNFDADKSVAQEIFDSFIEGQALDARSITPAQLQHLDRIVTRGGQSTPGTLIPWARSGVVLPSLQRYIADRLDAQSTGFSPVEVLGLVAELRPYGRHAALRMVQAPTLGGAAGHRIGELLVQMHPSAAHELAVSLQQDPTKVEVFDAAYQSVFATLTGKDEVGINARAALGAVFAADVDELAAAAGLLAITSGDSTPLVWGGTPGENTEFVERIKEKRDTLQWTDSVRITMADGEIAKGLLPRETLAAFVPAGTADAIEESLGVADNEVAAAYDRWAREVGLGGLTRLAADNAVVIGAGDHDFSQGDVVTIPALHTGADRADPAAFFVFEAHNIPNTNEWELRLVRIVDPEFLRRRGGGDPVLFQTVLAEEEVAFDELRMDWGMNELITGRAYASETASYPGQPLSFEQASFRFGDEAMGIIDAFGITGADEWQNWVLTLAAQHGFAVTIDTPATPPPAPAGARPTGTGITGPP